MNIKIYRGISIDNPNTNIKVGDYVTTYKTVARYYAGRNGLILEKIVTIKDLSKGECKGEFFYTPTKKSKLKIIRYFKNNSTIKQYTIKKK